MTFCEAVSCQIACLVRLVLLRQPKCTGRTMRSHSPSLKSFYPVKEVKKGCLVVSSNGLRNSPMLGIVPAMKVHLLIKPCSSIGSLRVGNCNRVEAFHQSINQSIIHHYAWCSTYTTGSNHSQQSY